MHFYEPDNFRPTQVISFFLSGFIAYPFQKLGMSVSNLQAQHRPRSCTTVKVMLSDTWSLMVAAVDLFLGVRLLDERRLTPVAFCSVRFLHSYGKSTSAPGRARPAEVCLTLITPKYNEDQVCNYCLHSNVVTVSVEIKIRCVLTTWAVLLEYKHPGPFEVSGQWCWKVYRPLRQVTPA